MNSLQSIITTLSLILLLSVISRDAYAQHYTVPVQELDSTGLDTAFKHHPVEIDIDIVGLKSNSFDTLICRVTTTYEEDITGSPVYLSKETVTHSVIKLPLNDAVKAAFQSDGTINETVMDGILAYFRLRVRHPVIP